MISEICDIIIRKMETSDKKEVFDMMKVFYASEAVLTNGSDEIFDADIDACIDDNNVFVTGFIFENPTNHEIAGYSMISKSFSTEYGKPVVWIEDIYIKEQYRGHGIGTKMFKYIGDNYKDYLLKLEVEKENNKAISLYKKTGFEEVQYLQMHKENID